MRSWPLEVGFQKVFDRLSRYGLGGGFTGKDRNPPVPCYSSTVGLQSSADKVGEHTAQTLFPCKMLGHALLDVNALIG